MHSLPSKAAGSRRRPAVPVSRLAPSRRVYTHRSDRNRFNGLRVNRQSGNDAKADIGWQALVGVDADGIGRGVTASTVTLEVHPPSVIAVRSRQICGADKTGHDMTATANHTFAGRACRNDDDAAIPG
jgi:hypothetical protein